VLPKVTFGLAQALQSGRIAGMIDLFKLLGEWLVGLEDPEGPPLSGLIIARPCMNNTPTTLTLLLSGETYLEKRSHSAKGI
jgi:hypothetical protein